jgi:hypothetical protein
MAGVGSETSEQGNRLWIPATALARPRRRIAKSDAGHAPASSATTSESDGVTASTPNTGLNRRRACDPWV